MCRGEGKAQLSVPILLGRGPSLSLTTTERQGGLREVVAAAGGGDRGPDTTQCILSPGPAAFALACPVLAHLGHCSGLTIALPETPPLVLLTSIPRHPPHTPRCSAASSTSLGVGARAAVCRGPGGRHRRRQQGSPPARPASVPLPSLFAAILRHRLPASACQARGKYWQLCSSQHHEGRVGCSPFQGAGRSWRLLSSGGGAEREPGRRTWHPAPVPLWTVTPGGAALGNHRLPSGPSCGGVGRGHQERARDPTGDDSRTLSWDVSWEHKETGTLLCWGWPRRLGAGLEPPDLLSEGRRQLLGGPSASGEPHVFTDQTGRPWRQHFAPAEPDARGFPGLHCAGEDAEASVL
nr:uncharacterized protein LOC112909227 [Vulpes vulpes]